MLNGYQENLISTDISHNLEINDDINALNAQLKTYELIRKKSDIVFNTQIKHKLLNDFDSSQFREFNDPLDEIERRYMQVSNEERKDKKNEDFFDLFKKSPENLSNKTFTYDLKEDVKQKYLFNFVTNDIGKASCFQVNAKYLLIGTKYGFIFYYNFKENNHNICPPFNRDKKFAIISIDISYDEEVILCGYINGYIALYDLANCKLLKYFYSIHSQNASVLALKFYHNLTKSLNKCKFISSDNEGKVYKTSIEKNLFNIYNSEPLPIIEKNAGNISIIKVLKSFILNCSESTKNVVIVALASNVKVCIIQIEPKHSVIHVVARPSFIKDIYFPSVSWDEGLYKYQESSKKQKEKSIFLMISWEKYIDLLSFKENFDDEQDCFSLTSYIVGSLMLSSPAIYMTFISFNLIIGLMENSEVFFLHLDDIIESEESIMKNENSKEYLPFHINPVMQIPSKFFKVEVNNIEFLSINSRKDENSIYFLDKEENFSCFEVFSWQRYINKLLETNRKIAIFKTFEIFEYGTVEFIALIPKSAKYRKKNMKDFIKGLLKGYLIHYIDDQEDEKKTLNIEKINEATRIVIDFIIRIEEFEYFFKEIIKIFKDRALLNIFFLCLEEYIENEKFRFIPEDVLIQMISFYKQDAKLELIQKLILSLDLNKIDNFQIIAICMEFQLFKPLIYICTIYNNDFLTPLVKITSHYLSVKSNVNIDDSTKKHFGLLFLWYIKLCLSGKTIINSNIDIKIYELIIQQLVIWIFVKENLITMLELDAKFTFDICFLFFNGVASKIIRKYYNYLKNNSKDIEKYENIEPSMIPQMKMLQLLFQTEKELFTGEKSPYKSRNERVWVFVFIARIIDIEEYKIDHERCYEAIVYLLRNPDILDILYKNQMEFSDAIEIEKSKFMIKLIRYFRDNTKLSYLQINQLMSYVNNLDQVRMYLLMIKKEYVLSVQVCLNTKNELLKKLSFDWIQELYIEIETNENPGYLKDFNNYLTNNFKLLILMNLEKTQEIVKLYIPYEDPYIFLQSLQEDPSLQLRYLDHLFHINAYKTYNDKLLNRHLELICQIKPNEVLNNLKVRDYPLDSSIETCKLHKLQEPQAFLYLRSGAIEKVLEIYLEIFYNNLKNLRENPQQDPLNLLRISKEIIEVSKNNSLGEVDSNNNIWLQTFDKMINFVKLVYFDENFNTDIKFILQNVFSELLIEMWQNLPHILFIQKINNYSIDLPLGIFRSAFMDLIENCKHEQNIIIISKNSFKLEYYEKMKQIQLFIKEAEFCYYCNFCNKKFEGNNTNIFCFKCGHSYHEYCLSEYEPYTNTKCIQCQNEKRSMFEKVIFQTKPAKSDKISNLPIKSQNFTQFGIDSEIKENTDKREKKLKKLDKFDVFIKTSLKKMEEFTSLYEFDM